jgi:hypothetical protein
VNQMNKPMTAKELLMPRFEIIADFPNNHYGEVGTILDRDWAKYPDDDETKKPIWMISDFPHLFRRINWWENRTAEQMPKRVMSLIKNDNGEFDTYNIEEWDMDILVGWIDKKERSCCSLLTFKPEFGYIPVD